MVAKVTLDEQLLIQLQEVGEVQVEDTHGGPLVLMTVDARRQLEELAYDAGEWTSEEMLAMAANSLDDPQGWGAPEMDDYDKVYGDLFQSDGQDS
jgi:hypothetical protein